jgi:hypothetical protein
MKKQDILIASLLNERLGYVQRNRPDRVKQIDDLLKRYAVTAPVEVEAAVLEVESERAVAPKAKRKKREV